MIIICMNNSFISILSACCAMFLAYFTNYSFNTFKETIEWFIESEFLNFN